MPHSAKIAIFSVKLTILGLNLHHEYIRVHIYHEYPIIL